MFSTLLRGRVESIQSFGKARQVHFDGVELLLARKKNMPLFQRKFPLVMNCSARSRLGFSTKRRALQRSSPIGVPISI